MGVTLDEKTFLDYLTKLNISIGTEIEVLETISFDQSLSIKIENLTDVEMYKNSGQKQVFYRVFSIKKIQEDLNYYVKRYNPEYIFFTADK